MAKIELYKYQKFSVMLCFLVQGRKNMYKRILQLYGVVVLLGVLVGMVGSYFQVAISKLGYWLTQLFQWVSFHNGPVMLVTVLTTMLLIFIAWFLVRYIAPDAAGSGVPQIEGTLLYDLPMIWQRLLPVKFFGGVLAIGTNMILGREGPTIQLGGHLAEMLGEWLRITKHRRDTLIAAGAAAGLAVAFNAPLAGVLFVVEEMRRPFRFSFTNFSIVAICCVSATIIEHLILGAHPAIVMDVFTLPSLSSLGWFFLFGIIVGFAGLLFNLALMQSLALTDKLSIKARIIFVLLVGALIGYLSFSYPALVGGGYHIIEQSLTMRPSLSILLFLFVVRFFIGILCYSTGVPGGIFAPMLALGTLLGLACSYVLKWSVDSSIHPGMFAVAGMGALFSAAVRAPLTGIVLVVEMTENYNLILPLMVTCLTSTTIVQIFRNPPIYTQLLRRLMNMRKKSE